MGWLSFFKRKTDALPSPASSGETGDAVQLARTRARQRLIGAAVLVVIGVIAFPLVFETQPRPIPVDVRIDIPRKDGVAPLPMPPARGPVPAAPTAAPREPVITESRADAGRELPPAASATAQPAASKPAVAQAPAPEKPAEKVVEKPAEKAQEKLQEKAAEKAAEKVAEKTAEKAPAKPAPKPAEAKPANDAERAKALLEGKESPAVADAGRYVVQVGAFSDAAAAREMRQKVEKLGLKTYTQVAETSSGSRIRVRIGPFGSRDDADKALAKARAAGVSAVVLTL